MKNNKLKSISEIKKITISLDKSISKLSQKDQEEIEEGKKYYQVMMLLKNQRKQLGLSQDELAKRLNIPRTTITKIESGNRNVTVGTLMNIAKVAGKELVLCFK
jgi:DNA-binding XRE family transcriptional regulator